jgi:hypothetical protein
MTFSYAMGRPSLHFVKNHPAKFSPGPVISQIRQFRDGGGCSESAPIPNSVWQFERPMPVPVRQMPLMRQERRALHEEHRKRRHADIGHEVLDVFPAPLVRQTRTGRPQRRYKVLDRPHMAQ